MLDDDEVSEGDVHIEELSVESDKASVVVGEHHVEPLPIPVTESNVERGTREDPVGLDIVMSIKQWVVCVVCMVRERLIGGYKKCRWRRVWYCE